MKPQQTREEIMGLVRDALYEYGDIPSLSISINMSSAALYKLRNGTTKWPRWNTLEKLMAPLKLRLEMSRY